TKPKQQCLGFFIPVIYSSSFERVSPGRVRPHPSATYTKPKSFDSGFFTFGVIVLPVDEGVLQAFAIQSFPHDL
ncbi:hypothetical protein MD588_11680, partial [Photobacterium sp. SDRW27]|uniref:hypothetical protein n=1 Tax=Photobacterium obscurum TaxID=2829490 RepID=UPI0022445BB7